MRSLGYSIYNAIEVLPRTYSLVYYCAGTWYNLAKIWYKYTYMFTDITALLPVPKFLLFYMPICQPLHHVLYPQPVM